MSPARLAPVVLVLFAACAPLRPPGLPFVPTCLPEGVPPVGAWHPAELRWILDSTGQAWVDAVYLVEGRPLRALWLGTGELALVDPDPLGPTPAWIDPGVLVPQSGAIRTQPVSVQTCRWARAPLEGGDRL